MTAKYLANGHDRVSGTHRQSGCGGFCENAADCLDEIEPVLVGEVVPIADHKAVCGERATPRRLVSHRLDRA